MRKQIVVCSLFFCLVSLGLCARNLKILTPQKLVDWWNSHEQDTHTSIAAFGTVPWGRKLLGRLQLADPIEACDYIRMDGASQRDPILVVRRGGCPFYLKALYAQNAGAKMLIIVDTEYEEVEAKLMIDNTGQGENVHIPSVLLSKLGGETLIESLKQKKQEVSNINVVFEFALPKSDKIEYHAWLSSGTLQSFKFLRQWRPYEQKLAENAQMVPHYVHFRIGYAQNQDANTIANCICGGKYCSSDPDGDLPNTGADVVMEDLRQKCIINEYGMNAWWQYIDAYQELCVTGGDMKKCSDEALNSIRLGSTDIDFCVKRSFDTPDTKKCQNNKLLEAEVAYMQKDGLLIYPSVFINGFAYRGNLVPPDGLFEALCESFNKMPSACIGVFDISTNIDSIAQIPKRHFPVLGAALLFLTVFSIFACFFYRRHLRKEMYKQMIRDVNIAVSQYIAFKDEDERGGQEYANQAEPADKT